MSELDDIAQIVVHQKLIIESQSDALIRADNFYRSVQAQRSFDAAEIVHATTRAAREARYEVYVWAADGMDDKGNPLRNTLR